MLSRIAEALFWLGRYTERAEETARLLDVHYHQMLEDRSIDEPTACAALLDVMGVAPTARPVPRSVAVNRLLAFDKAYPGSIVSSLVAAWDNARGVRESISSDMWECINAAHEELPRAVNRARGQRPHEFFRWVKDRMATFAGMADSTMSRDDGWRFLLLGRSLERVDMTSRLLSARSGGASSPTAWVTTLRACSAHEAYQRTYQREVDAATAVEFLVLDRLFPRSVFHALRTAEDVLAELDPTTGRVGVDNAARRALGQARTTLEFCSTSELVRDLARQLLAVQTQCAVADEAIAQRFFRQARMLEWTA